MRRLILPLLLLVAPLLAAAQPNDAIAQFQQHSLQIKAGMTRQQVTTTMHALGKATDKTDSTALKAINASNGLIYRHPGYATVYLLVGFNGQRVSGTAMCQAFTTSSQCGDTAAYWREESE